LAHYLIITFLKEMFFLHLPFMSMTFFKWLFTCIDISQEFCEEGQLYGRSIP